MPLDYQPGVFLPSKFHTAEKKIQIFINFLLRTKKKRLKEIPYIYPSLAFLLNRIIILIAPYGGGGAKGHQCKFIKQNLCYIYFHANSIDIKKFKFKLKFFSFHPF